jgi:nitroreductase
MIRELVARLPRPDAPLPPLEERPVRDEEIAAVLGAARVAPSADNLQTWRFIIVRRPETKQALGAAVGSLAESLTRAPVAIVLCGVRLPIKHVRREQPFVLVDVPIALTHLLLQAAELGLGTSFCLQLDEEACARAVGLPRDARPIAVVALGWPRS